VTSPESVNGTFAAAAEHFSKTENGGRFYLDVVVNNAGYSLSGDTESATEEETHREMETLFFGTARVTTRAIEAMRQQAQGKGEGQDARGGVIFNISSLAGLCAFAGHAYYHAGKFAVEGFSESVAREVHPDWGSKCKFHIMYLVSAYLYPPAQSCVPTWLGHGIPCGTKSGGLQRCTT
jgi:NAD(P)-dependent dehydrogenase (short-subunit alcohol dehydrogenase family)